MNNLNLQYLPCTCYSHDHFVRLGKWDDDLLMEVVSSRDYSFWRRLHFAFGHVFRRQDLVYADVIVNAPLLKAAIDAALKEPDIA